MFFGLSLRHRQEERIHSVMEGIIFAQRETFEIFSQTGRRFHRIIASGGGAAFRKIIVSIRPNQRFLLNTGAFFLRSAFLCSSL
ncbi:MAG: hypothetical protein K6E38_01305 [Fretibacterium sp.]|nr:hypothetical protein [Fretibacterium sp.]